MAKNIRLCFKKCVELKIPQHNITLTPVSRVVIYNINESDLNLLGDAASDDVFDGRIFSSSSGIRQTGTFTIADELVEQDSLIARIQAALEGKAAGGSGLPYEGVYTVTPGRAAQTLETAGKTLSENIVVEAVPSNYGMVTNDGFGLMIS